jgi:hypothetical protein
MLLPMVRLMLPDVVATPQPDFEKILPRQATNPNQWSRSKAGLDLDKKFAEICYDGRSVSSIDWIMGQVHMKAIATLRLADVRKEISRYTGGFGTNKMMENSFQGYKGEALRCSGCIMYVFGDRRILRLPWSFPWYSAAKG